MGSLCKVRVSLKEDPEGLSSESDVPAEPSQEEPIPYPRSNSAALQVPLGDWTTLRLGEGQCDVTEACIERMRAQETCEVGDH